ncbi:MAG: hypothetical protein IEMM0006_1615 [bacterium]|nr:MAG: hypothetical protein IEMM0006_1615 [bacterium]
MKKNLGLDLGTNSIGWALVNLDFDKKQGNIQGLNGLYKNSSRFRNSNFSIYDKVEAG